MKKLLRTLIAACCAMSPVAFAAGPIEQTLTNSNNEPGETIATATEYNEEFEEELMGAAGAEPGEAPSFEAMELKARAHEAFLNEVWSMP